MISIFTWAAANPEFAIVSVCGATLFICVLLLVLGTAGDREDWED